MEEDFPLRAESTRRRRRLQMRVIGAAATAAFLLGVGATVMLERSGWLGDETPAPEQTLVEAEPTGLVSSPIPTTEPSAEPTPTEEAAAEVRQAAERVEQVAEQQGGLDSRVAAMEQRLARLDLQAQAAAGNAARAEGLLITFAARRSIDRGMPLGYLADQLRLRFGDARPNAVQTVIDAAQQPVTLDQLIARLDGLAPTLDDPPPGEGMFGSLSRELNELFVIRREDTPSPAAERRLERARFFLESGRVRAAIDEVRRLPNAASAREWIAEAQRYADAQRALELLETTAILEQRELRDGSGARVEQPSPVEAGD